MDVIMTVLGVVLAVNIWMIIGFVWLIILDADLWIESNVDYIVVGLFWPVAITVAVLTNKEVDDGEGKGSSER